MARAAELMENAMIAAHNNTLNFVLIATSPDRIYSKIRAQRVKKWVTFTMARDCTT
jgi:hypothetical protein